MRKIFMFLLGCVFAFGLAGCGDNGKNISDVKEDVYHFDVGDIESIDVFTGAVPSAAVKKTVTSDSDIEKIISILNDISIEELAKENDTLTGGIGCYFLLAKTDGTQECIHINYNLLSFCDQSYVMKDTYNEEELWNSLDYEEIEVGEEGLPELPESQIEL